MGAAFRRALDVAVEAVGGRPATCAIIHRNARRVLLPKFPYGLYYRRMDERIVIVACVHAKRHPRTWRSVMGPGIAELMADVAAQGIVPAGPIFSHHLRMDPDTLDFEIGAAVTAPVSAAGRVKAGQGGASQPIPARSADIEVQAMIPEAERR